MNKNLQVIYNKINGKVSQIHASLILGDVIAKSLYNFQIAYYDSNDSFDFSLLILESLSNELFENESFLEILIIDLLEDNDIKLIMDNIKLSEEVSFSVREKLIKSYKSKTIQGIINSFKLDEDYFVNNEIKPKTISHELVVPFSPIDKLNEDQEIPKEFLCLHDYQKRVKDSSTQHLIEDNIMRFLIHMPTGSGKTKTCVESMIDFLRTKISEKGFIIWFAHSKELCEQSYLTLKNMWKFRGDASLDFYRVFGDTEIDHEILNKDRAVLFIGFQKFNSILSSEKTEIIQFRSKIANRSKLVVVDEAHKSLAPTYKKAIDYCLQSDSFRDCKLIGLTATPGRSNENSEDNKFLSDYFDDNLVSITDNNKEHQDDPLKYLQDAEVLAEIEDEVLEFDLSVDLTKLNYNGNNSEELSDNQLKILSNSAIINADRNIAILEKVKNSLTDEKKNSILIFAASTQHCKILKMIFDKEDIESDFILGSTRKSKREKLINDFKNKELKVLINFSVLSTGFDAPKLNTLIIARTINSKILGSQIIGRALRGPKNGGNKKNYITVLKDNIRGMNNPSFLFSYWEEFWGNNV